MTESVVESADSTADYAENPLKIGLWIRAFRLWNSLPVDIQQEKEEFKFKRKLSLHKFALKPNA